MPAVRTVLPLALCFLPSFLLLGVAPLVAGLLFLFAALPLFSAALATDPLPPATKSQPVVETVHGVEIVREGFFGSRVEAIYDLSYVIPFSLVISVAALMLVRWGEGRVVPE